MGIDAIGIGAVADVVGKVVDRFFPDKTKEEQANLAAALTVIQGQLTINQAEAASTSIFTSGWRPFIGWVCGVGCAWNWIGLPVAKFMCGYFGHEVALSAADVSEMMPLLLGMLGLGSLRTVEKIKGVASQ